MTFRSQPRLVEGHRVPGGSYLPEHIEDGIRQIARLERKSVSWVKAQLICDAFGIDAATGKIKGEEAQSRRISAEEARRRYAAATRILKAAAPLPFRRRA
jgi:hypothetical protein